jgi:hypothetical protein
MPGRQRHPDGTQRRKHRPTRLTDGYLIARWLEREVLRQKKLGVGYAAIADLITRAARGEQGTGVVLPAPDVVVLPPNYSITAMSCCRACRRALQREPAQQVDEYRRLDTARLEDWLLNLAARIRAGDSQAINSALGLLKHKAELNGYMAPHKVEANGKEGGPLHVSIEDWRQMIEAAEKQGNG